MKKLDKTGVLITVLSIVLVLVLGATTTLVIWGISSLNNINNGGGDASSSSDYIGSSDDSSKPDKDDTAVQKLYTKLPFVAMPTNLDGQYLTEQQMLDKYRGHTDWKIAEIRTSEDKIKPTGEGTAYYFSSINGSYKNDGLSPEKPMAKLADLGKIKHKLKAGDVIYFERGSVFRGQLIADVEGVTYAAYGEGNKPEFYACPGDAAKKGEWVETETKNVYKYSLNFSDKDIGAIVFNGGEQHGIKCVIRTEPNGTTYNNTTGEKFKDYNDLKHNLHFYHNYRGSGYVYLYCEDGNPADVFDSIELNIKQNIISVQADNVTFDNLCLKYGGAHGIGAGTRKGLRIQNCEFGWIGGSIQAEDIFGRNYGTRYGNAVEIYGGCDDFSVTNCYFYQIYDAAVTFQYSTEGPSDIKMKNVDFSNNVMEYCNYSFEYFLTGGAPEQSYIENVKVSDNLMWYTGYGFCEQRPDKDCDAHIKAWAHGNVRRGKFEINNNLFAISKTELVQSNATIGTHSPNYSGNTYIQFENTNLGRTGNLNSSIRFDSNVKDAIISRLGDKKATVVYVKK